MEYLYSDASKKFQKYGIYQMK